MPYIGAPPQNRILSSADIAQGAVTLNDINFTDVPTNMDITGTIDKHTMRLAEGVTITGDVTISDDLVLAKISDDGVAITMTPDGSSRTIIGSGSIQAATIAATPQPAQTYEVGTTLTGLTGVIGSEVTNNAGVASGVIGSEVTGGAGLDGAVNELSEDTTPQLGGSLDVLAETITTSTTNGHIRFDKGITEKIGTSTVGTTTVTVDLSTGNFFLMDLEALSGNVVTFTISNPNATTNQVSNFVVKVIQGTTTTTRNFTWATIVTNGTNIDWAGGTGPDITTGADKVDIFSFTSYDNGTTWYGAIVGQEFS